MKVKNSFIKIFALMLVLVTVLSLCSCKSKKEKITTSTTAENVTVTESVTADASTEEQSTEGTTQPTTQAATTAAPTETQAQTDTPTEAVVLTGIESMTDGNKTIIYPAAIRNSQTRYPVIAWANGTACSTELYKAFLNDLANGGYIVIADADVMAGNGTSLIDSINYIIGKNSDSQSIFYNKVDTAAIGICGHSQGGRGCVNAAKTDSRIRAIVSVAGASNADESRGLTTPILFLTGTSDRVVVSSQWCKPSYDAVTGRAAYASLRGGIHTTCMTSSKKLSGYTLDWFNAYLKNDANAKAVFADGGKLSADTAWTDFRNKN